MTTDPRNELWDHAARRMELFLAKVGVENSQVTEFLGEDARSAHSALKNHTIPESRDSRSLHNERNWYCNLDEQFFKAVFETITKNLRR